MPVVIAIICSGFSKEILFDVYDQIEITRAFTLRESELIADELRSF